MARCGKIAFVDGGDIIIRNRGRIPCGRVMGVHNAVSFFRPVDRGVVAYKNGNIKKTKNTKGTNE